VQKAAVVGLGIGLAHCAGYIESKNAELAAVCDKDPVRLSKVGGTFSQGSMLILKQLFSEDTLKKTWEEFFTFTIVRNPINRLVSSYQYHTGSNYNGYYYKIYNDLRNWSFEKISFEHF